MVMIATIIITIVATTVMVTIVAFASSVMVMISRIPMIATWLLPN